MKSQQFTLFSGALLLIWSMGSDAHSSLEAMQNGGSLLKLTASLLHPLLENGTLSALGILTLVILGIAAFRHRRVKIRRLGLDKTRRV